MMIDETSLFDMNEAARENLYFNVGKLRKQMVYSQAKTFGLAGYKGRIPVKERGR